ncbi:hypothetical protein Pan110_46480 [Gimesia panareensis]|nr:hypothetical protein Pan110_46480 [Gimesia panareensis]
MLENSANHFHKIGYPDIMTDGTRTFITSGDSVANSFLVSEVDPDFRTTEGES